MHTSDNVRFYRSRRFLLIAACAAPLLVLGGAWWAVNAFVLTPRVPTDDAPIDECVRFVVHERGLPRLNERQSASFLEQQTHRLVQHARLRERFATALRRLIPEEQEAFRVHLFDALKPRVLAHVRRFHALQGEAQRRYLDERIVEYNRAAAYLGQGRMDKSAFGNALPDSSRLTELLLTRTSDEERRLGMTYFAALGKRITEILADPRLKQDFEARIAAP